MAKMLYIPIRWFSEQRDMYWMYGGRLGDVQRLDHIMANDESKPHEWCLKSDFANKTVIH